MGLGQFDLRYQDNHCDCKGIETINLEKKTALSGLSVIF